MLESDAGTIMCRHQGVIGGIKGKANVIAKTEVPPSFLLISHYLEIKKHHLYIKSQSYFYLYVQLCKFLKSLETHF